MSENQRNESTSNVPNPAYHLNKTVAMVGMMGAGKTAVGRSLAARLGVRFMDSDAEIELAANMSVQEIFAQFGEPFFREKEAQVISRLLNEEPCILSTGGGAFLRESNRAAISERGVSVWLDADLDLLWNRVRHKSTRPLLNTANPYESLRAIFEDRVPLYAQADISARANPSYSIEQMVDVVIDQLLARSDVLKVI